VNKNIKVGIIGAGIQGVLNALFLQKKGFNVTIFDRDNPGAQAASYGNAGHFSPYASVPLNRPDVLADVPAMLVKLFRTTCFKMELCSKNDSLVCKIYYELNYKKNDAHS
jgi:2-polyprenyl-6-methoxyphenol hydroxylase-like FAD-dependent oxidoreductase